MSGCRCEAGRLFQTLGSATENEKLLSSSRVFVLGTVRTLRERSEATKSSVEWCMKPSDSSGLANANIMIMARAVLTYSEFCTVLDSVVGDRRATVT